MDDQRNLALRRRIERLQMATVYIVCLVVYYYIVKIRSQRTRIDPSLTLEKERARRKIMEKIATDEGRKIVRMGPKAFLDLCNILERDGGLRPTQRVSIEEQVAKTLYILTHNVRNREIQFWFQRSGETTSRHFHRVLRSIIEIEEKYVKQPDGSQIPTEILGSNRFNPFFKDCVGAIDCTHVRVKVPMTEAPKYRGRKDFPTQNVLVACSFDLKFTYVLPGWEGTASDSRVLKDALRRTNCLKIPRGIMATPEREIWTSEMDNALIDAFLHQQNEGHKVGGSFTPKAYDAIIKELEEKFSRPFKKDKVKNRWKILKRNFSKCYDIFKNLSGFAWDSITHCWLAEPEVWEKLIEAKPEAKEWMNKSVPNYDKMVILCGGDRATGVHAETAADIRRKRPLTGESESLETNEVTLESMHEGNNDQEVSSPAVQVLQEENRAKRSKKSKDEAEAEGIKEALMTIAEAFRDSTTALRENTAVYEKAQQKLPIPENELWSLLENLKIDEDVFDRVYLYLIDHPEKIRGILGSPKERQKRLIMQMVFGSSGPSRSF